MVRLHVAVAVLRDALDRVLLARRAADVHQGGLWEFPGGKVEPGESVGEALARELAEELGITLLASHPLVRVEHDYADRRVALDVHVVTHFAGEPRGAEGQPLRWVALDALEDYPLPKANAPIVAALIQAAENAPVR